MSETHVHWNQALSQTIHILGTNIELYVIPEDPQGVIRVRAAGATIDGIPIPTDDGWEPVPDTDLEARGDGRDLHGMVRLRIADAS